MEKYSHIEGKNSSALPLARTDARVLVHLERYRIKIQELGRVDSILKKQYDNLDLSNTFYWLFHLEYQINKAYHLFHTVNARHFGSSLITPSIVYCARSTGGYYNSLKHEIGLSIAMTIELGESEFQETLLHEIAHIKVRSHNGQFYALLRTIGGRGHKAPETLLLRSKRKHYRETNYPVHVECPNCHRHSSYRTRRALRYACGYCCKKLNGGIFDSRFRLQLVLAPSDKLTTSPSQNFPSLFIQ